MTGTDNGWGKIAPASGSAAKGAPLHVALADNVNQNLAIMTRAKVV